MYKIKFDFLNYYVVCKEGEKAVANVKYFTDSTGKTLVSPQPSVGSTLSFPTFKCWETESTDIIQDSLEININRLNSLKSSSNTASLSLRRQPFFDYEGKKTLCGVLSEGKYTAEVKVYDNNTCMFTGCLLPSSTSWNVTVNGNSDVAVKLYDITALRMKKRFSTEELNFITYKKTLKELVEDCSIITGLPIVNSEVTPLASYEVIAKIPVDATVEEVLREALYEHNRVYYTDADGVLHIQEIEVDGESEYNIWASDDSPSYEEGDPLLYRHGNTSIQRRVNAPNEYSEAVVSFIPLKHTQNECVWSLATESGGAVTISAFNYYDGYTSIERYTGTLPTIEYGPKDTGIFGRTNRFKLTIPSGSTWNSIVIKARTYKSGGGGYWGSHAYLEKQWTETVTSTFYDEDGEPYTEEEEITRYETISDEISLGDEWEKELVFNIKSSYYGGDVYLVVEKNCNFMEFTSMHTVLTSSAIRWISDMEDMEASPSRVDLQDYESGLPLWYVGDIYPNSDPTTYDSRFIIENDVSSRPCSTTTTVLIDNVDNADPITAKWRIFAEDVWKAMTTSEFPSVETASIDGVEHGESYVERMSYIHTSDVAEPHANLVAKIMSMNSCTYTFYTDELIEPLTVVTVHDNMWSAMKQKMIITGRSKKYKNGTVYKYTASAITPSEYIKVRYPSARYNQIPVDRPRDGEDGKSSLYFGSLSWTQAQVDAHIVGSNYNFTNTLGVSVKTGDTIWIDVLNTTTGLRATLNCLVLSVTSGTPYAKVISYLWEGKDGKDGADGGEYSVQITGSSNYSRNKRTGGNQTLQYTASFKGYNPTTDTVTITSDSAQATVTKGTATTTTQPFTLSIPYTNTVNSIKVTVNVSHTEGSKTWTDFATVTLSVIDDTGYYKYYGALASAPSSYVIQGDFYFNTSNNLPYYYTGTGWVGFSDSSVPQDRISIMCSEMQKDALERVPVGTVTSSEWGYFRNIIAGTVTANYIKSQTGVFDDITVTNASVYGNLNVGDFSACSWVGNSSSDGDRALNLDVSDSKSGTILWNGEEITDWYLPYSYVKSAFTSTGIYAFMGGGYRWHTPSFESIIINDINPIIVKVTYVSDTYNDNRLHLEFFYFGETWGGTPRTWEWYASDNNSVVRTYRQTSFWLWGGKSTISANLILPANIGTNKPLTESDSYLGTPNKPFSRAYITYPVVSDLEPATSTSAIGIMTPFSRIYANYVTGAVFN